MASLGAVLQDESDVQVHLVALDVAVIDEDVHVLDPTTLHASQRLVGPIYGFLYSFLETIRMDGAQLGYACNSHASVRPPPFWELARLLFRYLPYPAPREG